MKIFPTKKPLHNCRGFFVAYFKTYYEQLLRHKEAELLDSIGDILQIELILYDLRKLYLQALDLEEDGNEVAEQLQDQKRRLRQLLLSEQTQLAELELDIAHAKFMIDQLNQKP